MLRIWCDKCKGTREQLNQNPFNVIRRLCPECDGKGYTEHEGNLEDLEFGFALHEALSVYGLIPIHQGQKVYRINFNIGSTSQHSKELIEWYRLQKGSVSNA